MTIKLFRIGAGCATFLVGRAGTTLNNKNPLRFLISVEVRLFSLNFLFLVIWSYLGFVLPYIFVLLILAVAAADVAVALALIVTTQRCKDTIYLDNKYQLSHK